MSSSLVRREFLRGIAASAALWHVPGGFRHSGARGDSLQGVPGTEAGSTRRI